MNNISTLGLMKIYNIFVMMLPDIHFMLRKYISSDFFVCFLRITSWENRRSIPSISFSQSAVFQLFIYLVFIKLHDFHPLFTPAYVQNIQLTR